MRELSRDVLLYGGSGFLVGGGSTTSRFNAIEERGSDAIPVVASPSSAW
jgi:hypothetical protein